MPQVNLALVGLGRWGRNLVRTIAGLDCAKLVAVATSNADNAALLPSGCRIVQDWRQLLAAKDVDGIVVATPPQSHLEILLAAIDTGKPVLVEKPLTATLAEAKRLRDALRSQKATIVVDHIHLFHPAFQTLQQHARQLGPIERIVSSAGNRGPYRRDVSVLWDWAPHDLAMALTLVPGQATVLSAQRTESEMIGDILAESIAFRLRLAGRVPCHVRVSTLTPRHRTFRVVFQSCELLYQDSSRDPLLRCSKADPMRAEVIPVADTLPLVQVVCEFSEAILTKNVDRRSVDLGLDIVELMTALECVLSKNGDTA